VLWQNGYAPG